MSRKSKDVDLEDIVDDAPPAIEPYTILGIEKSATADEIKSAYRKAALRHHPGMGSKSMTHYIVTNFTPR
jgi:DnaJ family protein C protein 9